MWHETLMKIEWFVMCNAWKHSKWYCSLSSIFYCIFSESLQLTGWVSICLCWQILSQCTNSQFTNGQKLHILTACLQLFCNKKGLLSKHCHLYLMARLFGRYSAALINTACRLEGVLWYMALYNMSQWLCRNLIHTVITCFSFKRSWVFLVWL